MSNDMTWKGASKYLKAAMATTLIASIGAAYTYDTAEAAANYNSDVQVEQAFNQHKVLSYSTFVDVKGDHLFFGDIDWATQFKTSSGQYLMVGVSESKFGPDQKLTEEQFATMIQRFYNVKEINDAGTETDLGSWSDGVYASLAQYGVPLAGYKDKTQRSKPITRGHMAQIVAHMVGQSNNLDSSVDYLMSTGISSGVKTGSGSKLEDYGYKLDLTRGQAAAFFNRLDKKGLTDLKVSSKGSISAGIESGYNAVDGRLVSKAQPKPPVIEEKPSTIQATNPSLKQVASIYEKYDKSVKVKLDNNERFSLTLMDKDTHSFIKGSTGTVYGVNFASGNNESIKAGSEVVSKLTGEDQTELYNAAIKCLRGENAEIGKVNIGFKPGGVSFRWN